MAELQLKRKEKDLQAALILGVFHSYNKAVEEAGKALNEHFKKYESPKAKKSKRSGRGGAEERRLKTTGPQMLDFLVECFYDSKNKKWRGAGSGERELQIPEKCKSNHRRRSPLMIALQEGNTDMAKQLIDLGASVAFGNKNGLRALHIACIKGQVEMVHLILETAKKQKRFCQKQGDKDLDSDYEVILNAAGPEGWTPLMCAVNGGHEDIVRILIECDGIDYSKINKRGQNVLHVASRTGKLDLLRELSSKSPEQMLTSDKKDWNILHQACSNGSKELLDWLLQWFHDNVPEAEAQREHFNKKSKLGYTPLLVACQYHKVELVEQLVQEDLVDVTACCHEDDKGRGSNGLHLAAETYAPDVAKVLIQAGCSLCQLDREGNTVLHVANKKGSYRVRTIITKEWKDKGIELTEHKNDEGKLPGEMLQAIDIPLEIKKLGEEAVEVYKRALNEGKTKLPRCSLLILGKEHVGKTSLYRQLVGKEFKEDLESTQGIDNNAVDTVDRRSIATKQENWTEMQDPDAGDQLCERLGAEVKSVLPTKTEANEGRGEKVPPHQDLIKFISVTIRAVENLKSPPPPPPPQPPQPAPDYQRHRTQPIVYVAPPPAAVSAPVVEKQEPQQPVAPPPQVELTQPLRPPPVQTAVKEDPPKPVPPPPEPMMVDLASDTDTGPDPPLPPLAEEEATVPTNVEALLEEPPPGMLTHKEGVQIGEYVRGKREPEKVSLQLNTLDFAGQKQYRPMHHCYIARRALYLVVFNIDDVLHPKSCKPIEEIRYWIHSINAHIYPPDKSEKAKDKKVKKVFLVGTHRGQHTQKELQKIDKLIASELMHSESKCVNHICCASKKICFFPVENSIDYHKSQTYLEDSGTKPLQEKINKVAAGLDFMQEEYPLKWLKLEQRLELCGKDRPVPVIEIEDALKLAEESRITDKKEQKVAFEFFHETGKIICLSHLPQLFLGSEQHKELANLIILRPDWLISVMKVIMEINPREDVPGVEIEERLVTRLKETGEADIDLLKAYWEKDKLLSSPEIDIHHLCLILQAYCLIYPNRSIANGGTNSEPAKSTTSSYIIPCKLPEKFEDPRKRQLQDPFDFVFDFIDFLPDEIYHRLICLALKHSRPPPGYPNVFSERKCFFQNLRDTNWIMEMDSENHKLRFSVIVTEEAKCHDYIKFVHESLLKICEDSRLEGLVYHGGIEAKCTKGCKGALKHLCCVQYDKEKQLNTFSCKPRCFVCRKVYSAEELYKCPCEKSSSSGKNTKEYKSFLTLFNCLAKGIQNDLTEVSDKAMTKNLITPENAAEAKNPYNPMNRRASNLLQILLDRIEGDSKTLYVVIHILRSIPVMKDLAEMLDPSCTSAHSSVHGASSAGTDV